MKAGVPNSSQEFVVPTTLPVPKLVALLLTQRSAVTSALRSKPTPLSHSVILSIEAPSPELWVNPEPKLE